MSMTDPHPDHTGVIRPTAEADECAHTALSLIYCRERNEALVSVADLQTGLVNALAEVDRLRAGRAVEQTMLRNVLPTLADNAAENEALRAEVASLRAFQLQHRRSP